MSVGDGFSTTVPKSAKLDCLNGNSRSTLFPSSGGVAKEIRIFWGWGGGGGGGARGDLKDIQSMIDESKPGTNFLEFKTNPLSSKSKKK